jgi:hypothetical protein
MSAKSIKIGFGDFGEGRRHVVISVKNSTEYDPGQILDEETVRWLCESTRWDVTRVPLREEEEKQ